MIFAEKLRELRTKAGLTQERLAASSGLGLGTIRDYEQGKREPLLSTAVKLARALGTSVEAFTASVDDDSSGIDQPERATVARGRPPKATPATPPAEDLIETRSAKKGRHTPGVGAESALPEGDGEGKKPQKRGKGK